ncbi:carboxymuconolactone decarboxylase family protein [Amylibacter sp. IMCC11727]|uniref:carboxymuconolactone decarboxylase family protein n=1 Tax=Amylibacter sp. IMCC11727 TaxID=3039851 RepID=UPI00244DECD1|nr:carboxymuconolactone decarboxylase family protein [Amylibacter sp. IMCC11727]WGI23402.1 carboxymuconolactone decarboxylase family protein [Amylibacter sp. IMCC11727]
MSDFSKMFEGFMKQGQDMAEQMGKEFAKNQAEWLGKAKGMMPEGMADMAQGMVGDGIDAKTRALATVAGLTAKGAEDTAAITTAIHAATAAGASKREVTETILQMTAIGAVTGVSKAMMAAMAAFSTDGGSV